MSDLIDFSIVILTVGIFCVAAIGISFFITKLHNKDSNAGKYECGFTNTDDIPFVDKKLYMVPSFIVLEMMLLWLLFYVMVSIFMYVRIQVVCLYFFILIFAVCLIYSERQYNE